VTISNAFNSTIQDGQDFKFLEAVREGRIDRALYYLAHGANIDARDGQGNTALLWAAKNDALPMALMLIANHASLDLPDSEGATALIAACKKRNVPLARALIDADASIITEDRHGKKAFDYALRTALPELVELFEKPMKQILSGIPTPDFARALRASKMKLDDIDPRSGNTLLTWAAGQPGQEHLAQAFIEAGANPLATNREGKTPLEVAKAANNTPMLKLLEEANMRRPAPVESRGDRSFFAASAPT